MSRRQMQPLTLTLPDGRKVGLPFLDQRAVNMQVLCDYLERDKHGIYCLAREGRFSAPGCTVVQGGRTFYVPCRIWAANHWVPAPEVCALLLGLPPRPAPARTDAPPLALVGH